MVAVDYGKSIVRHKSKNKGIPEWTVIDFCYIDESLKIEFRDGDRDRLGEEYDNNNNYVIIVPTTSFLKALFNTRGMGNCKNNVLVRC